jgi:hypothetical protein
MKLVEDLLDGISKIRWTSNRETWTPGGAWRPDLTARVKTASGEFTLMFEVKRSGEPRTIAQLAVYAKEAEGYVVLVAPLVSERGRALCIELGLGFVDMAGNAYLKFDGVLVDRAGRKSSVKGRRSRDVFAKKASRIVRRLLSSPKRTWTLQEIADEAKVSVSQAQLVVEALSREAYADKARGSIGLSRPGELLDAWAKIYDFSSQKATGYYCPLKDQGKILAALRKLPGEAYALTLGAAASMVAPAVRSTDVYIYAPTGREALVKALDLKPVEFGGNVYLVEPNDEGILFDTQRKDGLTLVSSLQLYLDLFNYPSRGREQAEAIREKALGV